MVLLTAAAGELLRARSGQMSWGTRVADQVVKVIGSQCIGCGVCIDVCPNEALVMDNGQSTLPDEEKCEGCGVCVSFCEQKALQL